MCFGSAENVKIGCKERRAKGKQKSGHQHGTVPQKLDKKLLGFIYVNASHIRRKARDSPTS